MVAVGLWAAQIGGRARWAVPAAFLSLMALGFVFALTGAPLPFVEPGILASVIGLGLLVALAIRLPVSVGAAIVGAFALFHGHAHGTEATGSVLGYIGGFALATAMLHLAGVGAGEGIRRLKIARLAAAVLGSGIALAGLVLITG